MTYVSTKQFDNLVADALGEGYTSTGPIGWPPFDPQCDDPETYPFCGICGSDQTNGGFFKRDQDEFYWLQCGECGSISWERTRGGGQD